MRPSMGAAMGEPEADGGGKAGLVAGMDDGQGSVEEIDCPSWWQSVGFFLIKVDGEEEPGLINERAAQNADAPGLDQSPGGTGERAGPEGTAFSRDFGAIIGNQPGAATDQLKGEG